MLDDIRSKAYAALRSGRGNSLMPVRVSRGVLTFVNDMLGRPLAPIDEIRERRDYEKRRLRAASDAKATRAAEAAKAAAAAAGANGKAKAASRDAAPVVLYVDGRSGRDVKRIEEVLKGREIPFQKLSVDGDEATRSWVMTTAKANELPLVFVAGSPVGGYDALVQLDVQGQLQSMVFGAV